MESHIFGVSEFGARILEPRFWSPDFGVHRFWGPDFGVQVLGSRFGSPDLGVQISVPGNWDPEISEF